MSCLDINHVKGSNWTTDCNGHMLVVGDFVLHIFNINNFRNCLYYFNETATNPKINS